MKLKRNKKVRRILNFYKNSHGVKPPYTAILDGTFCKAALSNQVNIAEQLPKYLSAEVVIATTRCIIKECQHLGSVLYGPLKVLQQYTVIECKHKGAMSATKCLLYHCRNATELNNYIAGTQDPELSDKIRSLPRCPLIYVAHKSINLESPAEFSQPNVQSKSGVAATPAPELCVNVPAAQLRSLELLKKEVFGEQEKILKKKRKNKGPNPLSCKKKKVKDITVLMDGQGVKKRSRTRHKKNQNI